MPVTFGICFKQHFDTQATFWCPTIPHRPGCFCPWTFFQNIGFNMVPSDPFMSHLAILNLDILQGSFRLCNWLSLRRLVSWINHLPPACCSTFWKSIFKHQLGCRFDILDSISSFFLYFDICKYMSWYIISLFDFIYFLNILYFFKYSCTNIFHRRSLCTFYYLLYTYLKLSFQMQGFVFNLSPPSDAYMRQWIGSALVHIMTCRLFGAKPLSKLMLCYCLSDP